MTKETSSEKSHHLLLINACVRKDSRTKRLADALVEKLKQEETVLTEVRLEDISFPQVDEAFLKSRDELLDRGAVDDPLFTLAHQFAEADEIVIAAPYWDLSFPAALKQYFEQINVVGITFRYTEEGIPVGLCRGNRIWYVATAGGNYVPDAFGYGYVNALAQGFYGIHDVRLVQAVGLDLYGADPEAILKEAIKSLE